MKYYIETWGCQMNDHDSEKLAGVLREEGHEPVESMDEAELVLLNTCSIREKAVQKVYSELGRLRQVKQVRPLMVGVAGCMAQQDQDGIFKRAPHTDFVMGTKATAQLPSLIARALAGERKVIDTADYPDHHLWPAEVMQRRSTAKALVTIMEGCSHACTYCVVPSTRGPERSRPFEDILDEIRHLVDEAGFREIELLGQNVNSYDGGCTFAELLRKVSEIDGVEWIRFTTSHPMNFTQALARELATNPKVAPFLHLPIQSGSDRILRRMRRDYTYAEYVERLGFLGEARERIALSTDFIVGFPGETDEDFEASMRALEEMRYDTSFSFLYSPRPGTSALRYPDSDGVDHAVSLERLTRLQARQNELTLASHEAFVGRTVDVRVESREPAEAGHWMARTGEWVNVRLRVGEGRELPFGRLVQARITQAGPHFVSAELA